MGRFFSFFLSSYRNKTAYLTLESCRSHSKSTTGYTSHPNDTDFLASFHVSRTYYRRVDKVYPVLTKRIGITGADLGLVAARGSQSVVVICHSTYEPGGGGNTFIVLLT